MTKEMGLIGQKFNYLTVIDGPFYEGKYKKWLCQCDCGNIKKVQGNNLKSGMTKSCGCLHKKTISNDLTGKVFGCLTVIKDTGKRTHNRNKIWKCQCRCGTFCEIPTTHLNSGHTSSCGCQKQSKGEDKIRNILKDNHIFFEEQKTFQTCKKQDYLRFDFYVNNKYLIEYDGEQHFKCNHGWNTLEKFMQTQEYDKYKNNWCKWNKIPLIRIPYTHLNKICLNDLLLETSDFIWEEKEK